MEKLDSFINVAYTKKESFIDDYINTNNTSVISPYIAYRNIFRYNLKDLESIADTIDESLSSSVYFGYLNNRIKLLRRLTVGQPFINFTMEDTSGVSHSLAEMINGKYFLIDFWASWCSPCTRQNPKLVALYNKYKDKGFDILGVSLDSERDKWILAIHVDSLPWMQVSDLQSWKNNASKLYGVLSIPSNVLFDPNGKIIARKLNADRLSSKLEEIFGI
jgi:peroxiredoxin